MDVMVLAHAGAGSLPEHTDATEAACERAVERLHEGDSPLDAAVAACVLLEDDARLNAGTGSNLRLDGETVEMDASCMDSDGRFGAVAVLQRVKNPVRVARHVLDTPHLVLAGEGALAFARRMGHGDHDPVTQLARQRHAQTWEGLQGGVKEGGWSLAALERHWNYTSPPTQRVRRRDRAHQGEPPAGSDARIEPPEPRRSDTVGVIVRQADRYAAASSSGGLQSTLRGRVGDVPVFGAGIYAGPKGAVAVTGDGEHLMAKLLSWQVYQDLAQGRPPATAIEAALHSFDDAVDVGIVALSGEGGAGGSNRRMAWSLHEVHA